MFFAKIHRKRPLLVGDLIWHNLESVWLDVQVVIKVLIAAHLAAVARPSGLLPAIYR